MTNPKPFRLRTDERTILKEATLERKQLENENQLSINSTGKVRSEGRLKNGIKKSKKTQESLMGTKTPDISTSAKDNLASCKSQQKDANNNNSAPRSHLQKHNQRTLVSQAKPEGDKASYKSDPAHGVAGGGGSRADDAEAEMYRVGPLPSMDSRRGGEDRDPEVDFPRERLLRDGGVGGDEKAPAFRQN